MEFTASTGTVGDSYNNALAENVNGSYKNEIIHTRMWNDVVEVEIATFEWVNWWNDSSSTRASTTARRLKWEPSFGNATPIGE